ncbi:MAG: DEAD/DEAH box helicase family protein, partial [Actinomycetota bacterium]|nr:DEAD/DEAH box helicase family protein [Actinomycetota bacterium]
MRFGGTWRHYQALALEAFEADRRAGRRSTHLVAPPGSGKTLLGMEVVRRLGVPALVLAPNSAIQGQWLAAVEAFGATAAGVVAAEPAEAPVTCLTYQSLARLDDPGDALTGVARRRWAAQRARAEGETVEEIERRAAAWSGRAAERREREIARVTATLKREVARGEHPDLELADLLGPGVRGRVDALRDAGVSTVVLDECHHLASLWGYIVRVVLEELGDDVHVVGLTATPPNELTAGEAELYEALLGPVDFQVPTPAVVKDGHLAPFQELAWLVEPLPGELAWLREHDARFQELVTTLLDETPDAPHSLAGWVIVRLTSREVAGSGDPSTPTAEATVSWPDFQRRHPRLAAAGVRFLATAGLRLPTGAPRGEAFRRAPDLDDWLVLLDDYGLRCLAADPSPVAHERLEAVRAALAQLGWQLTRQGMRRGAGEVDRLLTTSAAKTAGLVEVLATELDARGEGLRALVVADSELAQVGVDPELRGVLDPGAGTARAATAVVADDVRTAPLRPLLVTGRGLRCAPGDAPALLEALAAQNVEG